MWKALVVLVFVAVGESLQSQPVTLTSRYPEVDTLASISAILHSSSGELFTASMSGELCQLDWASGRVTRKWRTGHGAAITALHAEASSGAVYTVCADGSLYFLRQGSTTLQRVDAPKVLDASMDSDTLWCLLDDRVTPIVGGVQTARSWSLPSLPGNPTAILKSNEQLMVGTQLGFVLWLMTAADSCAITSFQQPIQSLVLDLATHNSKILYTSFAGSWFISPDQSASPISIPEFADLYPFPEQVRFRITAIVRHKGEDYTLAAASPVIGVPAIKLCRFDSVAGQWKIAATSLDSKTLDRLTAVSATNGSLILGGASGFIVSFEDTISWQKSRTFHEGDPWEFYSLSEKSVVAARRLDSTSIEVGEISVPELEVIAKTVLNGRFRGTLTSVQLENDTLFIGLERSWTIFDMKSKIAWTPDTVPSKQLLYSVDLEGGIVWGTAYKFIYAWSTSGRYLGSAQVSATGPIRRLIPTSERTVIVVDYAGPVVSAKVTEVGVSTTPIYQPNSSEWISCPASLDNDVRILVGAVPQTVESIVRIDHNDPATPIVVAIEPVGIPEGNILFCMDDYVTLRRNDTLVNLYLNSGEQENNPLNLLGAAPDAFMQVVGLYRDWIVTRVGPDRLGYFPVNSSTSVHQDQIQHVFFKRVFPNPATKTVSVEIGLLPTADRGSIVLALYDLSGKLITRIPDLVTSTSDKFSIVAKTDVASLLPGTYVLVLSNRGYLESTLLQVLR